MLYIESVIAEQYELIRDKRWWYNIYSASLYRNEFIYFICIESLDRLCLFGVATTYYILGRLSRRKEMWNTLCGVCVCNSSILVRGRRLSISGYSVLSLRLYGIWVINQNICPFKIMYWGGAVLVDC
jgi:hypothetical protein